MKKTWIITLIVFLLASNLALLGTLIFTQNSKQIPPKEFLPERNFNKKIGFNKHHNVPFSDYIAKNLDLSPIQVEQLKIFSMEFHENKKGLGKQMAQVKRDYFTHLATKSPDEVYLKELADSLGKLLAKRMLLDYNHYQNIKSICTPEQAEILDSLGKYHIHHRNSRDIQGRHENPDE